MGEEETLEAFVYSRGLKGKTGVLTSFVTMTKRSNARLPVSHASKHKPVDGSW